jgi:uncharacterized protein (DUF58 family)
MTLVTQELLARVQTLRLQSRRKIRAQQRGEKSSLRKGSSLEFADYREYLQGDDIRSIDWNAYARCERLYLKLFQEEESRPVYFLVDGSESMRFGNPSKFEFALALASVLSYASLRRYDRPQIIVLHNETFRRYGFSSQRQFFPILDQLGKLKTGGQLKLNSALMKIALSRFARGIFFVISDFYSTDGFEALKLLASAGNDLHCWQLLTPEEWAPAVRGEFRFFDSETSDPSDVSISPQVLKSYERRLRSLQNQITKVAHQCGASYLPLNTQASISDLVLRDLRKTGILL